MGIHKVMVTGGSGKAGREVIEDLLAHGYQVTNVDLRSSSQVHTYQADLTDLGQVFGMVEGKDAIIHLAAIPWPGEHAPEVVFRNNVMSTFNILQAACVLGVRHVVLAGSESALGFPFCYRPITPEYLPIDEDHPLLAQDSYGISKILLEELARGFCRRDVDMSITSLRLSFIIRPEDYQRELQQAWTDLGNNTFNLWCYIDSRDVATACRLAVERKTTGFEALYIVARNTLMREPTLDLVNRFFPGVSQIKNDFGGNQAPLAGRRAREVLGFEPKYTWEMVINPEQVFE